MRSLDALAKTANHEHTLAGKAARKAFDHAIACGTVLLEARARIPRGEWLRWCEHNLTIHQGYVSTYTRMATYHEQLQAAGVDTVRGAIKFLKDEKLRAHVEVTPEKKVLIRVLLDSGLNQQQVAKIIGVTPTTVGNHVHNPEMGMRKRGRAPEHARIAITDEMIEGLAGWLADHGFGPLTDHVRDLAVDALHAALDAVSPPSLKAVA